MRVEEVKTSFVADTQKYIRDIQKAQKVLNTFLRTDNMTQREKAENRLQVAIQKRARAEAVALTQELKGKQQATSANSKLVSSQNNVNKSISKSTSSSKKFGGELAHLARNVMTLYYSFKSLSKVLTTGIDFNRTKEDAKLAFTVMFRSADVATQKIKELQEYAIASPLSFKETISASKQLSAYGFGADTLVQNMEMLGTVAKATGHSLDDIAYVYGTLKTQGQAYARDLMQFSMRGIPIFEELAEVMRVDQKEIKKLTADGKVGFKEVEKAFKNMTKEGGKFGGLLDEYMQGFSGITSQLEDTFQQSMGQMTEPMFEALKAQIEGLIRVMDSGGMDKTFKEIGKSLADIVKFLGPLIMKLIEATPAIIGFFKAWLGYVIIASIVKSITKLNLLIPILTRGLIKAGIAVRAFASGTALSGMTSGLAMMGKAFSMFTKSILTALSGFAKAAWAIIAANPLLAAIMGIMAVGATIAITVNHRNQEKIEEERERIKKEKGMRGLFEYDVGRADMGTAADVKMMQEALGLEKYKDFYEDTEWTDAGVKAVLYYTNNGVKKLAEAYKVSTSEAAAFLYEMDKIDRKTLQLFAREESLTRATRDYNDALERNKDLQIQAWLAGTTGKDKDAYSEVTTNDKAIPIGLPITNRLTGEKTDVYRTMGGDAATDYIKGLEQALKNKESHLKYTWQDMYSPDMMKDSVQSAIDEIDALLVEASHFTAMREGEEIPWFNLTGWDEIMRKKREELIDILGGSGAGGKDPVIEIKLDPWFDREKMASATKMIFDDLELQRDKDFANARAKLDAQEISFEQYSRAINAIHTKYLDDRIEAEKEAVEKTMNLWREGSDDVWRDIGIEAHKELFAFLGDTRPIQNLWTAFTNGASRAVSSTINAFRHIKDLLSSFENPFSIGTSSSPIGIKIDIDKDVLESNAGNMWDKMVIFGNYIKEGFTIFKNNLSLFKESIIEFKESVLILGKNVAIEMIKGTQIGNVFSSVVGQRDAWIQEKKDDLIRSGYDVSNFDEEQAATGFRVGDALAGAGITQLIAAFAEMALSVENVQKVLDPFGTMMEAAGTFLKPLLSVGFSGIASALEELGKVVGKVLLPILMPIMMTMQIVAGILKMTIIPVLQIVGNTFAWLYDRVFVPVGNAIIDLINGIIGLINKIPGINIEKLRKFKTTVDMIAETSGNLADTMQYMINKLTSMIDEELQSLQDLYEVGAISGAEMKAGADEANLRRLSLEENLIDVNKAQMNSLADIYNWLVENGAYADLEALLAAEKLGVELPEGFYGTDTDTGTVAPATGATLETWRTAKMLANQAGEVIPVLGHIAGGIAGTVVDIGRGIAEGAKNLFGGIKNLFGFASGTPYIPSDMIAQVHKGEGIIPATFMDSIRAGELMLSAGNTGGGGSVSNYYITVEGSVTSENDLADSLAEKIEQRRTRGYGRR